jgi:hypothetical protein
MRYEEMTIADMVREHNELVRKYTELLAMYQELSDAIKKMGAV